MANLAAGVTGRERFVTKHAPGRRQPRFPGNLPTSRCSGRPAEPFSLSQPNGRLRRDSLLSSGNRIEVCTRFVWQYYFYVHGQDWGRMFLRICPYFPFNARICLNQHEWLARGLQEEGVFYRKAANAFIQCSNPDCLQQPSGRVKGSACPSPVPRSSCMNPTATLRCKSC
jgi:hypothetical protein